MFSGTGGISFGEIAWDILALPFQSGERFGLRLATGDEIIKAHQVGRAGAAQKVINGPLEAMMLRKLALKLTEGGDCLGCF